MPVFNAFNNTISQAPTHAVYALFPLENELTISESSLFPTDWVFNKLYLI